MPEYLSPGIPIQETQRGDQPIEGVGTSTVGFFGIAERGPSGPTPLSSFNEYRGMFGSYVARRERRIAIWPMP